MNNLEKWADGITKSFGSLWTSFIDFLPNFLGAIIVIFVGWIIAAFLGGIVKKIVDTLKIDDFMEKLAIGESLKKVGMKLNVGSLFGWLVKWFLIIVSLMAAADIMDWKQINVFLIDVVKFIPNVIIAVVILLAGIVLANFIHELIDKAVSVAEFRSARVVAGLAKWAILVFAFMVALVQVKIGDALISTLFTGFVAMISIAGGLAFGLGGKDHAKDFIEMLRKDVSNSRK